MQRNRSMPDAAVIPVLAYPDVAAAVAFLCEAFGFVERLRIGDHRAQLSRGSGAVVVVKGDPSSGGNSVMVRVGDADAHCAQAEKNGARIAQMPFDMAYGERQYTAVDFVGHVWTFSQSIADIDPAAWGGVVVNQ
ncbi:MAG: Glyoxalase/bleomycin resistance protein/dioxygenase [Rhodospirillales bacterium]|nr:Glyoxalase/bleomycin resistance protein/dioxygenase [Rhodospirillales bacterium]